MHIKIRIEQVWSFLSLSQHNVVGKVVAEGSTEGWVSLASMEHLC